MGVQRDLRFGVAEKKVLGCWVKGIELKWLGGYYIYKRRFRLFLGLCYRV